MPDAGARLLEELMRFRPDGLTANGWAVKAGVSRTIWADLRRHGNPSRRTLEKLLGAAGSSLAEFEALRIGHSTLPATADGVNLAESGRSWRGAPIAPMPLLAITPAGQWGKAGSGIALHSIDRTSVVGRVERPLALAADPDAYAVTMIGEAMWPRFRAGRRLLVSPAFPARVGDDVLVELAEGKVLIKELASKPSALIELRQFNPDVTFAVAASEVAGVQKVVGEAL